jgi:hypothetical protein
LFFQEIEKILRKSSEIILEKASSLIKIKDLNKQKLVIKGLMIKYIDVNIIQCAKKIMYPQIISYALETYENTEEYIQKLVIII